MLSPIILAIAVVVLALIAQYWVFIAGAVAFAIGIGLLIGLSQDATEAVAVTDEPDSLPTIDRTTARLITSRSIDER